MADLLITDVLAMSREERDALTDEQIKGLSYGIKYYEPQSGTAAEQAQQNQILWNELGPRLEQIETRPVAQPAPAKPARQHLICKRCGQGGYVGEYPFSTLAASGICDDCL